jgi:hypothetical protein
LSGGAIVLVAAVWTGPQMAGAAPTGSKETTTTVGAQSAPGGHGKGTTTTTAAPKPTTTTTAAPKPTTTTTAAPKPTTTTTPPPKGTTTTAAPPKDGGTTGPGSGGTGGGGGGTTNPGTGTGGGTSTSPVTGGGTSPSIGGGTVGTGPTTARAGGNSPATASGSRSTVANVRPRSVDAAPSTAEPAGPGQSSIAALNAPDGAAQATVRSMGSGQAMGPTGGLSLYAQLAAGPGPLSTDSEGGNPYVTFVILTLFGIGVCFTGRRRTYDDASPAFAAA